jgi:hypothetical protein
MAHAGRWKGNKTEQHIKALRNQLIAYGLETGMDVIVDDTNLSERTLAEIRWFIREGVEFSIQDFTFVPLETCIKRDLLRSKSVGEAAIRRMHKDFLAPKSQVYHPDISMPHAIICDVDGTLAQNTQRGVYDYSDVSTDDPIMPIVRLVQELGENREVIFVSGRDSSCYEQTKEWLADHLGYASAENVRLIMRKTGDTRKDWIVKREIYERSIIHAYCIDYVIDDRNSVVQMWRSLGLTVLQVADGDF